jgi:hypothetical protein
MVYAPMLPVIHAPAVPLGAVIHADRGHRVGPTATGLR